MEEQKKEDVITSKVKYKKAKQIKDNALKFLKNMYKKVCTFFSKSFKKIKIWFVSFFQKVKKALPIIFSKVKAFFSWLFQKIKQGLSFVFSKIKIFFQKFIIACKKFFIYLKSLKKSTKILIVSILAIILTFTVALTYTLNLKAKDMSTYNILVESLEYKGDITIEDEFLTSIYIEEEDLALAYQEYVLYRAMENNYEYYSKLLKEVKQTNSELRTSINTKLTEVAYAFRNVSSFYLILQNIVQTYPEDVSRITNLHELIRINMQVFIDVSKTLLPEIENYIFLYSDIETVDKLPVYLTKLQFHYAVQVQNKIDLGLDVMDNLADLESIIEKTENLQANSTNVYATSFILAYENYDAYNYYAANDKFSYYQSLTAGNEKKYVQAFYSFLNQSSYN